MEWKTKVTELLGCKYPIMQGAMAGLGNKQFVVVDGEEGKQYDGILPVLFDSPDILHYLAQKGNSIYLAEERIRQIKAIVVPFLCRSPTLGLS